MAKKFLDYDGLEEVVAQVKSLLLGKQDKLTAGTNITIANGVISAKGTTQINDESIRITSLESGVYQFSTDKTHSILYNGDTGTEAMTVGSAGQILIVSKLTSTRWNWYLFNGNADDTLTCGATNNSSGYKADLFLPNLLENIDDYVVDNLNFSTPVPEGGTQFALSAYQGYLLNQNKSNKSETVASIDLSIDPSTYVITLQAKDINGNNLGQAKTIDLPLESVVVSGSYDSATKEVVLTLEGGSTIKFSVADLVAGLQTEITNSNKLSADLVDDSTSSNKFVTVTEKSTWNNKQDAMTEITTAEIDVLFNN